MRFTAIVDPNLELAQKRIDVLKKGPHGQKWESATAFKTYQEMVQSPVSALANPATPASPTYPVDISKCFYTEQERLTRMAWPCIALLATYLPTISQAVGQPEWPLQDIARD